MWGQGMRLLANVFVWFQSILVTCLSAGHGRESPILKEDVTERKSFNFCGKLENFPFFTLSLFYSISNNACQTVAQYSDQAKNGREPSFRGRKQLCLQKHSNQRSLHSGDIQGGFVTPPLTERSTKNRARLSCHRYMYNTILFCKFDQIELGSWMTLSVKIYLVNFRLSITSLEWLWAKQISK